MRIKLTSPNADSLLRQTPARSGRWNDCHFIIDNTDQGPFDAWVVYERFDQPLHAACDPARTLLVTGEPPAVRSYDPRFLAQFAAILSPRTDLPHKNVLHKNAPIPWWAGLTIDYPHERAIRFDYDNFSTDPAPQKTKTLSLITTRKTLTPDHRLRLAFVEKLQQALGPDLDIFGHGFTPISDKFDAIAPYRYHLVLENSDLPHYWSEKLSDCLLAHAHPLYAGCPNLTDYFPQDSFTPIDRTNLESALDTIRRTIAADAFTHHQAARTQARQLLLNVHNFFPAIAATLATLPASAPCPMRLRPESDFTAPLLRRFKNSLKRTLVSQR